MTRASMLVVMAFLATGIVPTLAKPNWTVRSAPLPLDGAFVQAADADVAGEWMVSFATPRGPLEFTMYVLQDGRRLTGRLTNENGEFPFRGSVEGAHFTMTWSFPDTGGPVEITFTGTIDGDTLSGTAKLGTRGTGPLSGTRVGR